MSHAPSPVRKAYFDNLYRSIAADAETRAVEADNRKKQLELERRELELKEQSLKLREALQRAGGEEPNKETTPTNPPEVELFSSPCSTYPNTNIISNQSKWMQLLGTGLVVEKHHLCNAENGAEFVCVHNRDSTDFMNQDKFERFILRKTKCTEPYEWDLMDETGSIVVEHIVEDEDQGPSKEWGPYGWYRHPSQDEAAKGCEGKTADIGFI